MGTSDSEHPATTAWVKQLRFYPLSPANPTKSTSPSNEAGDIQVSVANGTIAPLLASATYTAVTPSPSSATELKIQFAPPATGSCTPTVTAVETSEAERSLYYYQQGKTRFDAAIREDVFVPIDYTTLAVDIDFVVPLGTADVIPQWGFRNVSAPPTSFPSSNWQPLSPSNIQRVPHTGAQGVTSILRWTWQYSLPRTVERATLTVPGWNEATTPARSSSLDVHKDLPPITSEFNSMDSLDLEEESVLRWPNLFSLCDMSTGLEVFQFTFWTFGRRYPDALRTVDFDLQATGPLKLRSVTTPYAGNYNQSPMMVPEQLQGTSISNIAYNSPEQVRTTVVATAPTSAPETASRLRGLFAKRSDLFRLSYSVTPPSADAKSARPKSMDFTGIAPIPPARNGSLASSESSNNGGPAYSIMSPSPLPTGAPSTPVPSSPYLRPSLGGASPPFVLESTTQATPTRSPLYANNGGFSVIASPAEVPEDGPLFRATLAELEKKSAHLKHNVKHVLRSTDELLHAYQTVLQCENTFLSSVRNLPGMGDLLSYMESAHEGIQLARETYIQQLQSQLLHPLRQLYVNDIKTLEGKKKEFDQSSDEYYHSLSKYLSMKNANTMDEKKLAKAREKDAKYARKRSAFQLQCFNYYSSMLDLHTRKSADMKGMVKGAAEGELSMFEETMRGLNQAKPVLEGLDKNFKDVSAKSTLEAKEREELRKQLEVSLNAAETNERKVLELEREGRRTRSNTTGVPEAVTILTTPPAEPRARHGGVRELDFSAESPTFATPVVIGSKREGFLFTTKAPESSNGTSAATVGSTTNAVSNSSHWFRVWCVLSGGTLQEYGEWKKRMDPSQVIDLRLCTVREVASPTTRAMSMVGGNSGAPPLVQQSSSGSMGSGSQGGSHRRFCFEIISPYFVRVYQATSEEDCRSWIKAIANAIEKCLNGTGEEEDSVVAVTSRRGSGNGMNESTGGASLTTGDSCDESGTSTSDEIRRILSVPGNHVCADCGADKPTWCSLNLGIVICKECSGAHRGLGTHLSKVRSLYLDRTCYTPEVVAIFEQLGNEKVNAIYEYLLTSMSTPRKPSPTDQREVRSAFIQAKYADLLYISTSYQSEPISMVIVPQPQSQGDRGEPLLAVRMDADREEWLRLALQKGDVSAVLHAWAILLKQAKNNWTFGDALKAFTRLLQSDHMLVPKMDAGVTGTARFLELNGFAVSSGNSESAHMPQQ